MELTFLKFVLICVRSLVNWVNYDLAQTSISVDYRLFTGAAVQILCYCPINMEVGIVVVVVSQRVGLLQLFLLRNVLRILRKSPLHRGLLALEEACL